MQTKQRPSLSELKVGLFVLVACFVLALAIFTIGRVDIFESQFWARTYLSNISGLKSGDVVLLGGVEVGNVVSVEITPPGEKPPPTEQNQLIEARVAELRRSAEAMQEGHLRREPTIMAIGGAVPLHRRKIADLVVHQDGDAIRHGVRPSSPPAHRVRDNGQL